MKRSVGIPVRAMSCGFKRRAFVLPIALMKNALPNCLPHGASENGQAILAATAPTAHHQEIQRAPVRLQPQHSRHASCRRLAEYPPIPITITSLVMLSGQINYDTLCSFSCIHKAASHPFASGNDSQARLGLANIELKTFRPRRRKARTPVTRCVRLRGRAAERGCVGRSPCPRPRAATLTRPRRRPLKIKNGATKRPRPVCS